MILVDADPEGANTVIERLKTCFDLWNENMHLSNFELSASIGVSDWKKDRRQDDLRRPSARARHAITKTDSGRHQSTLMMIRSKTAVFTNSDSEPSQAYLTPREVSEDCRGSLKASKSSLPATTFADLALPLLDQLYNFAHWLTKDPSEAEDLVQETYAKALRAFSSFQAGTNFRAWMYRILRNSFLTSRTGVKVMVPIHTEELEILLPCEKETPEGSLMRQETQAMVQQALSELPPHSREILILCHAEEMSYQELSQILGIPMGTVMSRLFRARRRLRKILEQSPEGVTSSKVHPLIVPEATGDFAPRATTRETKVRQGIERVSRLHRVSTFALSRILRRDDDPASQVRLVDSNGVSKGEEMRTGPELRPRPARLQRAQPESRESRGTEPRAASSPGTIANGRRIGERTNSRVQRAHRNAGAQQH